MHATAVDEDVVFLDIDADAYFCLPGAAPDIQIAEDGWRVHVRDPALASDLLQAGLLCADLSADGHTVRLTPPPPIASALKSAHAPPRRADIACAIASTLDVALAYRGCGFREIIGRAPRPAFGTTFAPAPRRALLDVVDGFHRWIPYAPVSGKCLLRSFMLRRLLQREGHSVSWVFGVSTWPFQAHCWLQVGDLVLDDSWEQVTSYRPIMVV